MASNNPGGNQPQRNARQNSSSQGKPPKINVPAPPSKGFFDDFLPKFGNSITLISTALAALLAAVAIWLTLLLANRPELSPSTFNPFGPSTTPEIQQQTVVVMGPTQTSYPTYTPAPAVEVTRIVPVTQIVEVTSPPIVVTATSMPTATPLPNTDPNKVLDVGQTWENEGANLTLLEAPITSNHLSLNWKFTNNTGQALSLNFSADNFQIIDNLGNHLQIQGFNGVSSGCPQIDRVLNAGESVNNTGCENHWLQVGFDTNCQVPVTELTVIASNISSRIKVAKWKIPVKLC